MQGHGRIIAPDFCVAHREANSGLSTLNRTKSILSIYHQQRQLQKQRGMCLNDTYPFCQQPLSGNCHSICFSKPVLWAATPACFFMEQGTGVEPAFTAWEAVVLPIYEPCACDGHYSRDRRKFQPLFVESLGFLSRRDAASPLPLIAASADREECASRRCSAGR